MTDEVLGTSSQHCSMKTLRKCPIRTNRILFLLALYSCFTVLLVDETLYIPCDNVSQS